MTLQLPAVEDVVDVSEIRWASPATGLWVASRRRGSAEPEYAGMVERLDGSYHARSARDRALGSFEGLESALAVVGAAVDDTPVAPRGVRAMLWGMIGGSVIAVFALALALVR